MPRLRTVSPRDPGWTRRRAGKGFVYLNEFGQPLAAEAVLRGRQLFIPPAWRRGAGKRFASPNEFGQPLAAEDVLRCRQLVIPPAWQQVWICPAPNGHIQAVGTDDAGRRQYLYHPYWRLKRDQSKHDRVLTVAARLPTARRRVIKHLRMEGMPYERALAAAFRLLD